MAVHLHQVHLDKIQYCLDLQIDLENYRDMSYWDHNNLHCHHNIAKDHLDHELGYSLLEDLLKTNLLSQK